MHISLDKMEAMQLADLRQLLLDQFATDFDEQAAKHPNDRFWAMGLSMSFTSMLRWTGARAEILMRLEDGAAEKTDFEHWARMPSWSGDEVSALLVGLDPRKVSGVLSKIGEAAARSDIAQRFGEVQAILKRGNASSFFTPERYLHPADAIAWARRFEIPVPRELEAAVIRMWAEPDPEPGVAPKPLDERERTTLLCIIGALARQQGIDISQHMKAGDTVAAIAPELQLSGRTIGEKLKLVREAMERRTR